MGCRVMLALMLCLLAAAVRGEDPYVYYTWNVSYGTISPLGVPQQGILINGQFPGPEINCTSNNNIVVNVFNNLDEPFLLTWHGVQHRKNSWQDGTLGTSCPIAPGTNYTYRFQVKDQIGSFFYYPTTGLHRAAGGFGGLRIFSRLLIPVPYADPEDEYWVLMGDWYTKSHTTLKKFLDSGRSLGKPDGVLINGKTAKGDGSDKPLYTMKPGKTYKYRLCNVGLKGALNFRIQGHPMKLVEMEGSHVVQNIYDSLDVHVGQCYTVLVTADQAPKDYYMVASTRFTNSVPSVGTITASAARPNPQGSYHYGQINITRTIKLVNSVSRAQGLRYAINGVSHVDADTPLKLAEYYGVANKVFKYNIISDEPPVDQKTIVKAPNVITATFRNFIEIIFENHGKTVQSYNLDGYSFFTVAIEPGRWSPEKRKNYNLLDAVSRHTVQVFPKSWAAIMLTFDNAGMWNLRSEQAENRYLGQQLYMSVLSPERSLRDEYNLPDAQLICGMVKDMPKPKPYSM
ncbi:L-ascorbate oxidase-like [Spatholobus suberectus]|nr:L-ascorbate oxidase-like [Spatholobus suberectus]